MIHHLTTAIILSAQKVTLTVMGGGGEMFNIICEELQADEDFIDNFSHEHTLLITGEGDPVEITRGRVIPQPDISTNHEEADNIIIQQTFMAVEQGAECLSVMADISTNHEEAGNIIIQQTFMAVEQGAECLGLSVMADDTDVYILLLHYYDQKELNIAMFMEDKL